MGVRFDNPRVVVQSWYCAGLSRELRPGRALTRELFGARVALYRGEDGRARALAARCPHLGADLGAGAVVGDRLRCPFHHWSFSGAGRCVDAPALGRVPDAAAFSYPTLEQYGAIWVFNGPRPLFPLPSFAGMHEDDLLAVALPPQTLGCHPHLVAANGLDLQHFRAVHGFDFAGDPALEQPDAFRTRLRLTVRVAGRGLQAAALRRASGGRLSAEFTTWGGNLATIDGRAGRLAVRVLFSHRPEPRPDGGSASASRTFLIAPKARGLGRLLGADRAALAAAAWVLGYIVAGDRGILDGLRFRENLCEADYALAAFIRQVERLPVFDAAAWESRSGACAREGA